MCARWGPKNIICVFICAFPNVSAYARPIPFRSSASFPVFVPNTRKAISLLSIDRAVFILVPHLSHITSCRPRPLPCISVHPHM